MNLSEKLADAVKRQNKPYLKELAKNLQHALPNAKVSYGGGFIRLYLYGEQEPDLKKWLFSVLDSLPEIPHPIERVSFDVKVDDKIELVTLINPTEFDVRSVEYAIESKLHFNQSSRPYSDEPLLLNHSYYSDNKCVVPKKFQ